MKKLFTLTLIFLYSLSVLGVAVNKFYCCGELESVTFTTSEKYLKASKESKDAGCCQNEVQTFKVKDSHLSSSAKFLEAKIFATLLSPIPVFDFKVVSTKEVVLAYQSHAPPLGAKSPIYLQNCNFRI